MYNSFILTNAEKKTVSCLAPIWLNEKEIIHLISLVSLPTKHQKHPFYNLNLYTHESFVAYGERSR